LFKAVLLFADLFKVGLAVPSEPYWKSNGRRDAEIAPYLFSLRFCVLASAKLPAKPGLRRPDAAARHPYQKMGGHPVTKNGIEFLPNFRHPATSFFTNNQINKYT